jgi:hypothetical protein
LRKHTRRARGVRFWAGLMALLIVPTTIGAAASSAGAAGSNTLTVKAGEYVYKLSGSPKAGWIQVNFDNAGVENHMMAVFELKPGVTAKQLKTAALSQDQSALGKIAAPNADPNGVSGLPDLIGPGQKTTTLTELPAGHYGMLCFVPAPDGKSHVEHGMIKTFDVTKSKSSLKPPTSGVTDVSISDSAITFPTDNLGRNLTLKVTNSGSAVHSFSLIKIADGKTLDDVKNYFDAFFNGQAPAGDPPGVLVGGISSLNPGTDAYLQQSLTAGHYGYASTQGNAPDDDYSKGLKGEFDVK